MLFSHLDQYIEAGVASRNAQRGRWHLVAYEAEGFDGVMLGCGELTDPDPITVHLGLTGPHRIFLGLYAYGNGAIRVRLSDHPYSTRFATPPRSVILPPVIHEVEWKACDLTGRDLIIEGAFQRKALPGALAFIRAVPLARMPAVVPRPDVWRPMCISNDGCGVFRDSHHRRPEEILETTAAIPDSSCMRSLLWGNGNADSCNYPTQVGNPMFLDRWADPHCACDGNFGLPNLARWQDEGWDSLKLVRDYTRSRDWELHVYIRMQAFAGCYPHEELVWSEFFRAHPEWWCRDRAGHPLNRLSYAYAEVRRHLLDLITEIAAYQPDGVCLCMVRGVPLVLYEPIVVNDFQKIHGVDPRSLTSTDERWLEYQAGIITAFIREVRAVLAPEQKLSIMVPGNEGDCRSWGFDVKTWAAEGIVDDLYPVGQTFNEANVHECNPRSLDFPFFQGLPRRHRMRLIPTFYTWTLRHQDPTAFRALIRSSLEDGADSYCIWDGHDPYSHELYGDIGFRDWQGPAPVTAAASGKQHALHVLNAFRVDEYGGGEVV